MALALWPRAPALNRGAALAGTAQKNAAPGEVPLEVEANQAGETALLVLLILVITLNSIDRVIVDVLVEPIRKEFNFSDTQMGLIGALGFALFYCVMGLPSARFANRYSRKHILAVGLATWSAMTVLTGRAIGFWSLLLAWLLALTARRQLARMHAREAM